MPLRVEVASSDGVERMRFFLALFTSLIHLQVIESLSPALLFSLLCVYCAQMLIKHLQCSILVKMFLFLRITACCTSLHTAC